MKKITLISAATVLGAFMFSVPVFASTVATLTPGTITVAEGAKFKVVVTVNPQGTQNYAEKVELNYSPNELEVVSFTQAPNWMALTQSGYDTTDNAHGVLIKTAGYASGFSNATDFGTVTFIAKKAGTPTIKIGSAAVAFEASSQTAISGNSTFVTITPSAVATTETTPAGTSSSASIDKTATNTGGDLDAALINQGASAAGSGISFSVKTMLWILGIAVLLGGVWFGYKNSKKKEEGSTPAKKN